MNIKRRNKKLEFFKSILSVKPVDFFGGEVTKEEAMEFCVSLMEIFAKYDPDDFYFNKDDYEFLKKSISLIGGVDISYYSELKEIYPDFFCKDDTMEHLQKKGNYLNLPLSIIGNCISSPEFTVDAFFEKNFCCDKWLENHKKTKDEEETL